MSSSMVVLHDGAAQADPGASAGARGPAEAAAAASVTSVVDSTVASAPRAPAPSARRTRKAARRATSTAPGERKPASGVTAAASAPTAGSPSSRSSSSGASARTAPGVQGSLPFATNCPVSPILVPSCGAYWGIYSRRFGNRDVATSVTTWESMLGRRFDIVLMYYDFSNRQGPGRFPDRQMTQLSQDRIPLYDWETRDYVAGSYLRWADIAAGQYDTSVVIPQAQRLKAYGKPVMLGIDHEMDISYPKHGSPADYRAMYRHIHDVFAAQGVTNVVWVWDVTGWLGSNRGDLVKSFYPGDGLVDWIGYDPYNSGKCNGGGWKTFEQTISTFYRLDRGERAGLETAAPAGVRPHARPGGRGGVPAVVPGHPLRAAAVPPAESPRALGLRHGLHAAHRRRAGHARRLQTGRPGDPPPLTPLDGTYSDVSNCVRDRLLPSGSRNHATFAPPGAVHTPRSVLAHSLVAREVHSARSQLFGHRADVRNAPSQDRVRSSRRPLHARQAQHRPVGVRDERDGRLLGDGEPERAFVKLPGPAEVRDPDEADQCAALQHRLSARWRSRRSASSCSPGFGRTRDSRSGAKVLDMLGVRGSSWGRAVLAVVIAAMGAALVGPAEAAPLPVPPSTSRSCAETDRELVPACGVLWGIWPRADAAGTVSNTCRQPGQPRAGRGRQFDLVRRYKGWGQDVYDAWDAGFRDSGHLVLEDLTARNFSTNT